MLVAPAAPPPLTRALRAVLPVRPGEGALVAVLVANVFLILCGYYLLKTAREGLILGGGTLGLRGDELKLVATAAMAAVLLAAVPAYGWLASRVTRRRLIAASYAAVIGSLLAFYALGRAGVPVGLAFFVWLGIVNVFLVAQFWSFAADLFTVEQGTRLFAVIAVGASAGAIVGPRLALAADTFTLMPLAAAILVACLGLFVVAERVAPPPRRAAPPVPARGGFALVLADRHLRWIAALVMISNVVNTIGELILSSAAVDAVAGIADPAARREAIKAFYADVYGWVNLAGFVLQAVVVSRVMVLGGVRVALLVLPALALAGYGLIGLVGGVALVRAVKIAENAVDYSLQNTVQHALWLPVPREAKYQAKAAVDTFFVRFGDLVAAAVVAIAVRGLGLGATELALVDAALAAVWIAIALRVGRGAAS